MGAPRTMPSANIVKRTVPVDTSGMDPEMAATLNGEAARITKVKSVYAPQTVVKKTPVKKQPGMMDRLKKMVGMK